VGLYVCWRNRKKGNILSKRFNYLPCILHGEMNSQRQVARCKSRTSIDWRKFCWADDCLIRCVDISRYLICFTPLSAIKCQSKLIDDCSFYRSLVRRAAAIRGSTLGTARPLQTWNTCRYVDSMSSWRDARPVKRTPASALCSLTLIASVYRGFQKFEKLLAV
jgi:hypothetical protein